MIHSGTSFNPDSDKKDADDFAHHSKTKNRRFEDKRRQDTKKQLNCCKCTLQHTVNTNNRNKEYPLILF